MNVTKISVSRLGKLDVDPSLVFHCRMPLIGFEDQHRFVIVETPEHRPFLWLQSLDDETLIFALADPRNFEIRYRKEIVAPFMNATPEDLRILVMLVLPEKEGDAPIPNAKGPLVFNTKTQEFGQWIIDHSQSQEAMNIESEPLESFFGDMEALKRLVLEQTP